MSQQFSKGYAVIVGVGANLPVTLQDARALSDFLIDPSRCAYPRDHVCLLTGEGARRDDIVSALTWLAQSTSQDDTAIVYFSGHGIEQPNFYLIPFGYDLLNPSATLLAGNEFTELLRQVKTQKLLVLLDCCHAGGQAEAKELPSSPMPASALEELARSGGRVVIASSRKDEISWASTPYSQFTKAVLEGLAGFGASERDGFARVLDLALYVGRVVPNRTGDRQHPLVKVSNLKDNFAIAWYAGGSTAPKELPWQAAPLMVSAPDDKEADAYRRMLASQRDALLLIDERMSEYVDYRAVPLDLVRNRQRTETRIAELETLLRER